MKGNKYCIALLLLLFVFFQAQSQSRINKSIVSGYVIDELTKEPMAGAIILRDTVLGVGGISDADGFFSIHDIEMNKESYLSVEYVGYENKILKINPTLQNYKLSNPIAIFSIMRMDEVLVYGTSPIAEIKGDTTQYNAGAYKINPDASAGDLLAKMPGFKQNDDGSVTKEGESITRVLVDGKDYFRDDPSAALSSLPANIINSIQFIDDKSEESKFTGYDDGTRIKTINIVTKNKSKHALMGEYYAGYGYDGKYVGSVNTNLFTEKDIISLGFGANNINMNPLFQKGAYGGGSRSGLTSSGGLKFNYDRQFKGGNVSVTYLYNHDDLDLKKKTTQSYLVDNRDDISYDTTNVISNTHKININYVHQINERNKIIARPSFSFSDNTSTSLILSENIYENTPTLNTSAKRLTSTGGVNYLIRPDIRWFHNFTKQQFITVTFKGSFSNDDTDRIINSDIAFSEGIEMDSVSNQNIRDIISSNNIDIYTSYTHRFGEYSGVNLRYNVKYDWSDIDKKTYMFDKATGEYTDLNKLLSNTFARDYLSNKLTLGYSFNKKGEHMFNAGVGYKNSILQNNMTYPTFNPSEKYSFGAPEFGFSYRYRLSKSKMLNVFIRGMSNLPSLSQLQDVLDVSDPLNISIGNPNLNQSYSTMLMAYYRSSNKEKSISFSAYGRLQNIQNSFAIHRRVIMEDTTINGVLVQQGAQISTTENLDGYWNFYVGSTFSVPIKILKSNINTNLRYNIRQSPSIYNDNTFKSLQNSINFDFSLVSNISPNIDFTIGFNTDYTNATSIGGLKTVNNAITQEFSSEIDWIIWKGIFVNIDYRYRFNHISSGSSADSHQNILNAAIGTRLLNNRLEFRVSAFDILNQYKSILNSQNDIFSQDIISNNLTRYFTFSIKYKFNTMQGKSNLRNQNSNYKVNFNHRRPH